MKKLFVILVTTTLFAACNNSAEPAKSSVDSNAAKVDSAVSAAVVDSAKSKIDSTTKAAKDTIKAKVDSLKKK